MNPHYGIKLTETEIEGMFCGGYEAGVELPVNDRTKLVCLDGNVWKLKSDDGELCGFLRPENCISCEQLRSEIITLLP